MKSYSVLLIVSIGLFLSSCSNVAYENAVPKNTAHFSIFPKEIQGGYIDSEGDTLTIYSNSYTYGTKGEIVYLTGEIGDELVLKTLSGYYFLNFKNDEGYWEMIAAKPLGNELTIYCIDAKDKDDIKIINSKIKKGKVKSSRKKGKYIINPEKSEILELLNDDDICEKSVLKKI